MVHSKHESGVALPKYMIQPRPGLWSRQKVIGNRCQHKRLGANYSCGCAVVEGGGTVQGSKRSFGLVECFINKRVIAADVNK